MKPLLVPLETLDCVPARAGRCQVKPWDYRVTVVLPHLDAIEHLRLVVQLHRLQTVKPYILVIDTGSPAAVRAELETMREEDLEVHFIGSHGWRHSSEAVSVAMDLAQSLCRTDFMFCTHTDVFPRRRDLLAYFLAECSASVPAVGYRISPRDWHGPEWETMLGHSLLMLHMPTIFRIGASWSFQRIHHAWGYPWEMTHGWPDTETGFNRCLAAAGIKPTFLGEDVNFRRLVDEWHDHPRNYTGQRSLGQAYDRPGDIAAAIAEARQRIEQWGGKCASAAHLNVAPTQHLPCSCPSPGQCDRKGREMSQWHWQKCRAEPAFCALLDGVARGEHLKPVAMGSTYQVMQPCCQPAIDGSLPIVDTVHVN